MEAALDIFQACALLRRLAVSRVDQAQSWKLAPWR